MIYCSTQILCTAVQGFSYLSLQFGVTNLQSLLVQRRDSCNQQFSLSLNVRSAVHHKELLNHTKELFRFNQDELIKNKEQNTEYLEFFGMKK